MTVANLTSCLVAAASFCCLLCCVAASVELHGEDAGEPTFAKDIAPIVYTKCATCHRQGQVSHLSLMSYEDVRKSLREVVNVVSDGSMPPWKPVAGFGTFRNARGLTSAEVSLFQHWAAIGAPQGDIHSSPQPPTFKDGWQLGEPDLVLRMPEPFEVQGNGADVFRCFVIPLPLATDQFVAGFEFRPGNPHMLHHSILFLDSAKAARSKVSGSSGAGYSCFGGPGFSPSGALGGWSPGSIPTLYRADVAKFVKKGTDLVIQNHYHSMGVERDQSEIGIYFAKSVPKYRAVTIPVLQYDLDIPAGEEQYKVRSVFDVPAELQVLGISPHMHYLGHEMKVSATLPDGSVQPLIWIKDWDFLWQGEYYYEQPIVLPKGTRILMEASYDNSVRNPHNPSYPPKRVKWGEASTDEMALCLIEIAVEKQEDLTLLRHAILEQPGIHLTGAGH
jgi:hypothetical protein